VKRSQELQHFISCLDDALASRIDKRSAGHDAITSVFAALKTERPPGAGTRDNQACMPLLSATGWIAARIACSRVTVCAAAADPVSIIKPRMPIRATSRITASAPG